MSNNASFACTGSLDAPGLRISPTGTLNAANTVGTPMLNQGTFHAPSGTVVVNAGHHSTNHTGHWTIASGATLYFNGSGYHLTGGDITATGTGKLRTDADLTLESGVPLNVEDLLVSAATLTLNGTAALPADYDKVEFAGGIRAGDRNWTIKNLTVDSADFRGPHTTTVTSSFKKTGGGTLALRTGGPDLIVNAPATHDGGQICIDDQTNTGPGSDPLLEINSTWTMSNNASFACTGSLDAPGLRISPTGTLNAANTVGTPMLNQGTFHAPSGTVVVNAGHHSTNHTGHWTIASGATLYFNGSGYHLTGGDITATGTGKLRTDADLTLESGVPLNVEDLLVSAATLTLNGTAALPADYDKVEFAGGIRAGDRNWTIKNLTVDSADFRGPHTTTVTSSFKKTGGGTLALRTGSPDLIVNAPATHDGGQVCIDDQTNTGPGSDPLLEINSTWTMSNNASFACTGSLDAPGLRISPTGTLNAANTVGTPMLNQGTFHAPSGTVVVNAGHHSTNHTGHWTIASGATLYFNGSGYHLTGGDITATGTGKLRTDADLTLESGVPLNVEDLLVSAATLTLNGTAALPADYDKVEFAGGIRAGDRNWTIKNLTVDSADFRGPHTTTVTSSFKKTGGGTLALRTGSPDLIVNAPATHDGGQICIDDQTNTGPGSDPLLEINSTWTMSNNASFACTGSLDAPGLRISPTGTLNAANTVGTPMLNQGTFHAPSGTVVVNAGHHSTNHTGHWTIASGATLYFNGSGYHLTGGDITATGTGKLRTDADLTLESGVPLNVEDLLVSAATLTLNGTAALPADYDKVEFAGGIRAGDRNWTIKNLTVDSADFRGPHTTTVTSSFKKTGGGTLALRTGSPDLIVNAPATHDGGQICIDDQTNTGPGSDPLLEINSTWTMSNNASFACTGSLDAPGLQISPTGTLNAANTVGTPMLNQGTFHAPSGTVVVNAGHHSTNHTGHWTIASGATLYFNGSGYHLTGGDITATGTGKLRTDADLTLESGVPLNVEELLVSAATLTLNGTAALPADYDKVEFAGGIRAGDRNWTIKNLTVDSARLPRPPHDDRHQLLQKDRRRHPLAAHRQPRPDRQRPRHPRRRPDLHRRPDQHRPRLETHCWKSTAPGR